MAMQILQPPGWARPRGYSNGILAAGRVIFLAGQVGFNAEGKFESDDLAAQTRQALGNILAILAEAGAKAEHIVRMTWYITDRQAYLAQLQEIGVIYRELIGKHYPVMTVVEVTALIEGRAKVEIEATAVLP
jgi:enamine deaminase RidA (YjgF/YER057c/UK114 family)